MSDARPRPLRRVGHKGADALVPGNTIASFERAVEIGVEMIELDVLGLANGSPLLVAHDLEDAAGRDQLTLAEALDAFTRPPLERVEIDLDLKLPGREDELVDQLRERGLVERAMVSTMHVESLHAVRALEPDLRRGWTYPKVRRAWDRRRLARPAVLATLALMRRRLPAILGRRASGLGAAALWCYHPLVTGRLVAAARRGGVELIAWTVDDAERVAELRGLGVDGICTNDPRLLARGAPTA